MKKENLMFAIIGLLVGLIVGFTVANSVNRSAMSQTAAPPPSTASTAPQSGNPALPPNHPPLGTSSGDTGSTASGAPLPQVTAAIDKAKKAPQNFEAQMTAGDLFYQIQRFDDAAKFYETANKLKTADTEPMIKAGNSY